MSDSPSKSCPRCGAPLGADAPEALCPACLMDNAAWSQTLAEPDASEEPTLVAASAGSGPEELDLDARADFGGYRIVRQLGKGGMGAVYEAEQLESGRRVALKVLSHKLDSEEARKRFLREGRLAASINHPNSVYVFGTEEIEGTPTIAMEIVPGGTLQEKVLRDGPLPAPQAVDAVLQLIGGLDAAREIGILHRDVKPSNCFLDEQGGVKIGDFGLSISTDARGDSHLTVQGSLLGTPAFSSPEQLRGEELNARSDMYSVGATLFYLLTAHAPFEEGNMVKLLSRVLEEPAPEPRTLRPDVPRGLSRIVLRCLSKTPADRFKSYAELREALRPFRSQAPTPATLAWRLGAWGLDTLAMGLVNSVVQLFAWGGVGVMLNEVSKVSTKGVAIAIGLNLLTILYFALSEGRWGASIGKRILRLRVVGSDRSAPGFARAFLRASLLMLYLGLPYWILNVWLYDWVSNRPAAIASLLMGGGQVVHLVVLFAWARRANGFAGLHGLATGTRVIRVPAGKPRPRLATSPVPAVEPVEVAGRIGPFHIIEVLDDSGPDRWVVAYDTKLLRRVWVHELPMGTPVVSRVERELKRPGRLRWITGRRSAEECWDAYEAPGGRALVDLLAEAERPSWEAVRFWLLDLVNEFAASEHDGTTPETLALDRVWITEDGHAKLFDFPVPGSGARAGSDSSPSPSAFLGAIAKATVGGVQPPVPGRARPLLDEHPPALETLYSLLHDAVRGAARVSRLRRFGVIAMVSCFPAISILMGVFFISLHSSVRTHKPELMELSTLTLALQMTQDERDREDLRRAIAHGYREVVEDPSTWSDWRTTMLIDIYRQRLAREAVAAYPTLTPDEIVSANRLAEPALKSGYGGIPDPPPIAPLVLVMISAIFYGALPALLAALCCRRGLALLAFGTIVVRDDGTPASRPRCLWRGVLAWAPFLGGSILAAVLYPILGPVPTTVVVLGGGLILLAWSALRPQRSLHDRLAGTWLVPS